MGLQHVLSWVYMSLHEGSHLLPQISHPEGGLKSCRTALRLLCRRLTTGAGCAWLLAAPVRAEQPVEEWCAMRMSMPGLAELLQGADSPAVAFCFPEQCSAMLVTSLGVPQAAVQQQEQRVQVSWHILFCQSVAQAAAVMPEDGQQTGLIVEHALPAAITATAGALPLGACLAPAAACPRAGIIPPSQVRLVTGTRVACSCVGAAHGGHSCWQPLPAGTSGGRCWLLCKGTMHHQSFWQKPIQMLLHSQACMHLGLLH